MDTNKNYIFRTLVSLLLFFPGIVCSSEGSSTLIRNAERDLEIIRERVIEYLMSPDVDVEKTRDIFGSVRPDGSWSDIDYEDVSRTGWHMEQHLLKTINMAHAYKKQNNPFFGNPGCLIGIR